MLRLVLPSLLLLSLLATPLRAVQTTGAANGGFDTTAPTNSNITNWVTLGNTGVSSWGDNGVTGWNYIGGIGYVNNNGIFVDTASGTYLGNGWVLTAAHVGGGAFDLGGTIYSEVSGSGQLVTPLSPPLTGTTEDLYLFKIAAPPDLPSLTLNLDPPSAFLDGETGSSVVMLGLGGGHGETWGDDTVDIVNEPIQLMVSPTRTYNSNDFLTINGSLTLGTATSTNDSTLVGGDSGGGDFIFNPATQTWDLAGINEVVGSGMIGSENVTFSGFVQLSDYASEIHAITGVDLVPEPSTWVLLSLGLAFIWGCSRRRFSIRERE